jgi:ArsR family transcriptional regulator
MPERSGSSRLGGLDAAVSTLRALAEPTRLRLALLLSRGELTVTEISQLVGQSQPSTSRHLRLLLDASILERSPEGTRVFYRLRESGEGAELVRRLAERIRAEDPLIAADTAALERLREARAAAAASYLREHAGEADTLRPLTVAEADVERALLELIGAREPIERLLDIGTGTGRILELLAPVSERSVGLDVSRDMVALARAKLGEARLSHASVRQGDLHRPPFEAASFDVAVMHHVLHLLDDPAAAIADAARLLRPGGRLLVADFAPHQLEFLREQHGHRHLGVDDHELASWAAQAGLAVEAERTLEPGAGEQLAVRVWLLRAGPGTSARAVA